jgi:hypothetical protein
MMLNQGDDSSIPVPAVFMFAPAMPVVVNRNTYQGLKMANGSSYEALSIRSSILNLDIRDTKNCSSSSSARAID